MMLLRWGHRGRRFRIDTQSPRGSTPPVSTAPNEKKAAKRPGERGCRNWLWRQKKSEYVGQPASTKNVPGGR